MRKTVLTFGMVCLLTTGCKQVEVTDVRVAPYQGDRKAAVSLTFDDGMLCHYTDVAPELEKNGLRGTFWIIGANMDSDVPDYPWMTWEQVADMSRRGHEMSNHSWNHHDLTQLSEEQLRWEIAHNDSVIETVTGKRPKTFCYPYNAMNEQVVAICSEGRVGTRTFQEAQGQKDSHQTAETMTAWLDTIVARCDWGVTMTHGTTYGWDMWEEPQLLYDFFGQLAARNEEVWVAPFAQVAAYIEESKQCVWSWTKNHNCLVLSADIPNLDPTLYDEPLTFVVSGNFTDQKISASQGSKALEVKNLGDCLHIDVLPNGEEVIVKW